MRKGDEMEEVKVGLVKGRHELPVDDYIFDSIEDPMDFNRQARDRCAEGKAAQ